MASYTTAEYVQEELRASEAFSTSTVPTLATVERWIDEADAYIDTLAGRQFGDTPYSETIDYKGQDTIPLKNSPIISITSVLYTKYDLGDVNYALDNTASATTDYSLYEDTGDLIITSPATFREGKKTIQVNYNAGYSTIPLEVRTLSTKMVAQRVLNTLINSNVNEGNDGGSISVGSISIVEPASYGVNSYKELGTTIKELQDSIVGEFKVHRYGGR
jgi:hypothetical protein